MYPDLFYAQYPDGGKPPYARQFIRRLAASFDQEDAVVEAAMAATDDPTLRGLYQHLGEELRNCQGLGWLQHTDECDFLEPGTPSHQYWADIFEDYEPEITELDGYLAAKYRRLDLDGDPEYPSEDEYNDPAPDDGAGPGGGQGPSDAESESESEDDAEDMDAEAAAESEEDASLVDRRPYKRARGTQHPILDAAMATTQGALSIM